MEAPKYCLEAVAIWDKTKINPKGPVKRFCAYGATEYGTDSKGVKKADAIACYSLALRRFTRLAGQAANN